MPNNKQLDNEEFDEVSDDSEILDIDDADFEQSQRPKGKSKAKEVMNFDICIY